MTVAPRTLRRAQQIIADGLPIGARLYPCVCRAGRHAHGGTARTGGCKDTGCQRYRLDSAYDLAYRALDAQATQLGASIREADRLERQAHYRARPRVQGEWSIGASDTATCPRKIQYRNLPPEDFEAAPEDSREARMGSIIHAEVTARMRRLYPWREYEGRVLIPGLDRESEFDSYDPVTAELEDYKTAGDWKWDRIGEHGPDEETWDQVMLYAYAVAATGRPVRTVRLSYIKRCNGHDETFTRPYDEHAAKAALDRLLGYATSLDLIHHAREAGQDTTTLDMAKTGTGPANDAMCRRCFARNDCWNIEAAEAAGRSPESYTILGAAPEDAEVAWAIEEKIDAAAQRRAAETREDAAKTLLEGVEPGRYGAFEGYEKWGGGGTDWKARAEQLSELFTLPEGLRPALDDLPLPQRRRYSFTQWGRVRKATLERERRENPPSNVTPIRGGN